MSLIIYFVAHCLKRTSETVYLQAMVHESYVNADTPREKAQIKKKEKLIPPHDFKFFLPLSVLIAIGVFNRPTFFIFAVVPLFYWFQRGVATNSVVTPFQMFNFRIVSIIPGAVLTGLIIILSDSLYHGELTLKKLWHLTMDWKDWKVAPFQFIMYNVVPGNLDKHGTHPMWLHALVNLQLLYGPLGVFALYSALNFVAEIIMNDWKNKPGVRTVYALTMFTFIISLGLFSIFPHQEPRFLIPLTVPVVLMNAHKLRWKVGKSFKPLLTLWYAFNIGMAVFYGLVHQAGVTPAVKYIGQELQLAKATNEVNVIWSNTYMPPTYELLRISEKSRRHKEDTGKSPEEFPSYFLRPHVRVNFHDLQGRDLRSDVRREIVALSTRAKLKKTTVENFIVLPSHMFDEVEEMLEGQVKFSPVAYFFPHVSIESPPDITDEITDIVAQITDGRVFHDYSGAMATMFHLIGHFGLTLYKFESIVDTVHTVRMSHVGSS